MHIALVTGAGEVPLPSALAVRLCDIWRERGHSISIGSTLPEPSDLALLHINTTTISSADVPPARPGVPFLNRQALDISKRHVSHRLVRPDDAYDGAVIVKTDENFYGLRRSPPSLSHELTTFLRRAATKRTWRYLHLLPHHNYPVLATKAEVPDWVWRRKDLVVEQFTPEIEGGLFVLRLWLFVSGKEYGAKLFSREPVVKTGNIERYEYIDDVPDQLREERRRLNMDFGKFDFVVHEGQPVLLDANKTPTVRIGAKPTSNLLNLADALGDFFPEARWHG